jgi:predicted enzyme related to lactoylglutathione lyase
MFLAEVSIETNDVKKLSGFYRSIMNLPQEDGDEVHQLIAADTVSLTVYNDGTVKPDNNRNISIAFTVEDVDKEYKRLNELGVNIIEPPTTRPWGARNMHFCDPDGNHIYFRSFPQE